MIRFIRKNPIDRELLNNIKIKDIVYPDFIVYRVYYNNNVIAHLVLDRNKNYITTVTINDKFKRKGLASFLYDYIENSQDIKLKPSSVLLPAGKAFWKNRLKKKNPTDLALLRLIKITKKVIDYSYQNKLITYDIWFRNKNIGYVELLSNNNYIEDIEIDENFRRKGLATYVYNYIEKDLGKFLIPSAEQLEDGKKFWKNRLSKKK